MISLANTAFQLTCNPQQGYFDLEMAQPNSVIQIRQANLGIRYRYRGRSYRNLFEAWNVAIEEAFDGMDSHLGKMKQLSLLIEPNEHKLSCQITFALPEQYPFLTWKISLRNNGDHPVWVDQIDMLRAGDKAQMRGRGAESYIHFGKVDSGRDYGFFSNGWQSWAFTAAYGSNEAQRQTRLGSIQSALCVNQGTPQVHRAGHYTSDFFGVLGDRKNGSAFLLGFLSQQQNFGTVESWVKGSPSAALWANGDGARLDPGEKIETDWAVIFPFPLDVLDPLAPYYNAVAKQNEIKVDSNIPIGWCSWYQFYQKISADIIRQNMGTVSSIQDQIPLKLIQIDDGFEKQIGDWFQFQPSFPQGVAPLAAEIKTQGFTPGLWLAPFIVHPKSDLIQKHPDYILRNKNGRPVNAGFIWNVFTTALDLTHPGAMDYAYCVVDKAAHEWGFPYLKLDFLYAGALGGQHRDPTRTRAQVLRNAMTLLRKAVGPETYLLGCGAPLGSSLGLFDAMRIGADVSGDWRPNYMGVGAVFKDEPHMPSAKNSLQNIITRAPLHKRWWVNDPDCLLLRPDTKLTLSEVQTLATAIAMTGGSLLLSDNLPDLPEERLQIARTLVPVMGERALVVDWFDRMMPRYLRVDLENKIEKWNLLALFNWEDRELETTIWSDDYHLPGGKYWVRSFWDGSVHAVDEKHPLLHTTVAPHGVVLLAVRERRPQQAQYLGGSLHISQGIELAEWKDAGSQIEFKVDLGRQLDGKMELYLPHTPDAVYLNGKPTAWKKYKGGIYQISICQTSESMVKIDFEV